MSHLSDGSLFFENSNSMEIQNGAGETFRFGRPDLARVSENERKVRNHFDEVAFRLQITVF